jgi:hypothetical protein
VVVARRLCDLANGGQILCSALVADLLTRGRGFRFQACGKLSLDGIGAPIDAFEVLYDDGHSLGASSRLSRREEPSPPRGSRDPNRTRTIELDHPPSLPAWNARAALLGSWVTIFVGCLLWIKRRAVC